MCLSVAPGPPTKLLGFVGGLTDLVGDFYRLNLMKWNLVGERRIVGADRISRRKTPTNRLQTSQAHIREGGIPDMHRK